MIKSQSYQLKGMNQDALIASGKSTTFAHEIMNLRLNTVGDYTTTAWTTEEGTLLKDIHWTDISDDVIKVWYNNDYTVIPIGQSIISDTWVVFATQELNGNTPRTGVDFIFKFWYATNTDDLYGTVLYAGDLDFDAQHPCETLPFYENDNIQKVYWIDGKNQPRVINICRVIADTGLERQFDFVQEVSLQEQVTITKDTGGAGMFPPGTVKYAITYYYKYGQETNIVYTSPLYYPIKGDRGCSPDELSGDSFTVKVTGIDTAHKFDYIRLYSIVRTSDDATPIVRIVEDKEIASLPTETVYGVIRPYALFKDTNTTGEIVDPTVLQYVGGREVIAQTMEQKSNTLFLGNLTLKQKSVTSLIGSSLKALSSDGFVIGDWGTLGEDDEKRIGIRINARNSDVTFYQHTNQMSESYCWHHKDLDTAYNAPAGQSLPCNGNSQKIKIFKYGEYYRMGIQFQDLHGNWSEVIFLEPTVQNAIGNTTANAFQNNVRPITDTAWSTGVFGVFSYTLPNATIQTLLANEYVKARIVCCYPDNSNRRMLTQGVVCPVLCNQDFWDSNSPNVLSSWFFRPQNANGYITTTLNFGKGTNYINVPEIIDPDEIQNFYTVFSSSPLRVTLNAQKDSSGDIISYNYGTYGTVANYSKVFTVNSPEIAFDDTVKTLSLRDIKYTNIGTIALNSYSSTYHVDASAPMQDADGSTGRGFIKQIAKKDFSTTLTEMRDISSNAGYWEDMWAYNPDHGRNISTQKFPLFPFERKGSLNDYEKDITQDVSTWAAVVNSSKQPIEFTVDQHAVLNSKVFANICYSANSIYASTYATNISSPLSATQFQIFDSTEVTPLKLSDNSIYYGNMNTILPVTLDPNVNANSTLVLTWNDKKNNDYYITGFYKTFCDLYASSLYDTNHGNNYGENNINTTNPLNGYAVSSVPIPMTYTSTPHGVLEAAAEIKSTESYLHLSLVDIIRNSNTLNTLPLSYSDIYLPCGPTVDLRQAGTNSMKVFGLEGDYYYQRFDCLKTYPRSTEDTNQIVEILSYMCESRINLDGRYDRNRGLSDNTTVLNTNFNLINMSYTQTDNFFSYTQLEDEDAVLDEYSNQITWTKEKTYGEKVDIWTNLTLASTADAEGVCGEITKLIRLRDTLYLFQEHGIAQIGYNEKTAISTEAGVPLEIANSGKYTGLIYLSREIGCQNKWSISNTNNGVMFIDDSRKELMSLGNSIVSLSTAHGFDAFFIQNIQESEYFKPWTPYDTQNFITYYDKHSNDVYYINNDWCLAWNEQSGTFTSFYSYNGISLLANIGTHSLMWNTATDLRPIFSFEENQTVLNTTSPIWAAREHNYDCCKFFGVRKPYWITLACDGVTSEGNAFFTDKVFNNIEYRADVFDRKATLPRVDISLPVFDVKAAYNAYQMYKEFPQQGVRKFNTWYVQLPRATYLSNGVLNTTRDRVRGPYCYITLKNTNTTYLPNRMILHDFTVSYDIK